MRNQIYRVARLNRTGLDPIAAKAATLLGKRLLQEFNAGPLQKVYVEGKLPKNLSKRHSVLHMQDNSLLMASKEIRTLWEWVDECRLDKQDRLDIVWQTFHESQRLWWER